MHEDHHAGMRAAPMRRNPALEALLAEINSALPAAAERLVVDIRDTLPKIFLVGPMRSGTTLYMQWLASTALVAYPTNLLSRFYGAPWMGAKIQQLLTDPAYAFRDEIPEFTLGSNFRSDNGKTSGALAPNEFWYFWRRLMPALTHGWCPSEELARTSDLAAFRDQINGLANIFAKPFAMKAMILNQNIELLAGLFTRPVFVWIQREPASNIQSVLAARVRQYGTMDHWYSFEVKEFPRLRRLDPLHAVAGQIYAMNTCVGRALAAMPKAHTLIVDYARFCSDPRGAYAKLLAKLQGHGACLDAPAYAGAESFTSTDRWTLEHWSQADAERAYADMARELRDCD